MLLKVDKDRGNDPVCGTMHKKRTPCHHKHLSSPYLCNIYVKSIFIAVFLCLLFLLLLLGSTTSKKTTPLCIWNLILWGSDLKSIRQNWEGGDMAIRAHNFCHDNRQLIVLAINCNHSTSKNNCNWSGLIGFPT